MISLVSVIIPCFNASRTIERAISSIGNQTCLPGRIIVVDDASTDGSVEIVKKLQQKSTEYEITLICLPYNRGASAARNCGLEQVDTEFVAFLDADDAWHPEKLRLQIEWMQKNPSTVLLSHRCIVDGEEQVNSSYSDSEFRDSVEFISFNQLLLRTRFSTPSVVLRTITRLRFDEQLRYAEDYDYWLRLVAKHGPVAYSELPLATLYKSRFGASGLSGNMWAMQRSLFSVYAKQYTSKSIGRFRLLLVQALSFAAFLRRLALVCIKRV